MTDLERLIKARLSRRDFIKTGLGVGFAPFVATAGEGGASVEAMPWPESFRPVAANTLDTVTVPKGYRWRRLISWGDPLWSHGSAFDASTRGDAASQSLAFGDNCDGMALFEVDGRTILAVNNEYVNRGIFHGGRDSGRAETLDDVRKSKAAHGVCLFEIREHGGAWDVVIDSPFNRKITPNTPMAISGPARGHQWLVTEADPGAAIALGTWANCGSGRTPWGTYLSCEENFNGYFSSSDPFIDVPEALHRYGIRLDDRGENWRHDDERFDIAKHPNEPNRVGYVVEIDPANPRSTPRKCTALGRFKHENAELVLSDSGHVVVYMGDDERGEYLYRFVSHRPYRPGEDSSPLLDEGELSVARFNEDGSGSWLVLTPQSTGMASQAEICVHTRQAASRRGATTMDRPEWVAAHPDRAEVYCCLTNNSQRGRGVNAGGDAMPVGGPNPRADNRFGQIVRWRPAGGDHRADSFHWDLFVMAGNPSVYEDERRGSANVNAANMFNSPDGLCFDAAGRLWVRTDGNYSNRGGFAGMGNNQMLMADPQSGRMARFLVGPRECEITGLCWSGDRRTMFVGIQHPGERGGSHFPDGGESVPRSTVIAVTREDGGPI